MSDHPLQRLTPEERSRLEAVEGVVFDIQRYSLHDGPGLRTNVFLKGCPLHCPWCANPEAQALTPELALFEGRCVECGQFEEACPLRWGGYAEAGGQPALRDAFGAQEALCPAGALQWLGRRRSAGEVMAEVLRDRAFYEGGGGMTLTGGEPTLQPEMADALLRLAKAETISTAMQTCGHTAWSLLERLLAHLDAVLFDLKHMDSAIHREFSGVGNELILANLRRLAAAGAAITVRVPLIPGFNATEPAVCAIAGFVSELGPAVRGVELLPYHTLGRSKYRALGRAYAWDGHERLGESEVRALASAVAALGLSVNVGG
jgi:pyruvate formate lyase activating enzyme